MKTTEKKDLQTKTVAELKKLIQDAEKALIDLKLSLEQSKLKDTSSIFTTRKRIAVLKTFLTMKAKASVAEGKEDDKGGKKNG